MTQATANGQWRARRPRPRGGRFLPRKKIARHGQPHRPLQATPWQVLSAPNARACTSMPEHASQEVCTCLVPKFWLVEPVHESSGRKLHTCAGPCTCSKSPSLLLAVAQHNVHGHHLRIFHTASTGPPKHLDKHGTVARSSECTRPVDVAAMRCSAVASSPRPTVLTCCLGS